MGADERSRDGCNTYRGSHVSPIKPSLKTGPINYVSFRQGNSTQRQAYRSDRDHEAMLPRPASAALLKVERDSVEKNHDQLEPTNLRHNFSHQLEPRITHHYHRKSSQSPVSDGDHQLDDEYEVDYEPSKITITSHNRSKSRSRSKSKKSAKNRKSSYKSTRSERPNTSIHHYEQPISTNSAAVLEKYYHYKA